MDAKSPIEIPLNFAQRPTLILTWKNVSVWVKKKLPSQHLFDLYSAQRFEHVRILNKVNGYVKSGTLMAIMGPSGAGKTTLMATISQRIKGIDTTGEILVNRKGIDKEMMSRMSAFVPQDELLTKTLTIHEHMQFMACLMMDSRVTQTQRNRRINSLLLDLGLNKCIYTYISDLSGGELKRLSLAAQLLTDPPILFCDEPTTGLDSYNAGIVVEKLRNFASRGKAVICTIHQPASGIFELFHEVLLLAGGRVAFHGSVSDAVSYFESLNLRCPIGFNQAEFYVSQLAIDSCRTAECYQKVQTICDCYDESKYAKIVQQQLLDGAEDTLAECSSINFNDNEMVDKEFQKYSNIRKVNWCTQLNWLLWRDYIDQKRNKKDFFVRFALYMFIALLLATPYANITDGIDQPNIQNVEGLMYLIITETIFTFAYSVFHTFPAVIPQFLREISNGLYKPCPYYFSKILFSIPSAVVLPFVYTTVIFWIVGLHGGFIGYLQFCVPIIVCAIASTAYGFAMSAAFESVEFAALMSVPIDFVTIVFSGVYLNLAHLPMHLNWIRYISPFYYGTEAVSILQWSLVDSIKCDDDPTFPCIQTGQGVLEKYGFDKNDLYIDFIGLIGYYLILHLIGFISFWRRSRKQSIY